MNAKKSPMLQTRPEFKPHSRIFGPQKTAWRTRGGPPERRGYAESIDGCAGGYSYRHLQCIFNKLCIARTYAHSHVTNYQPISGTAATLARRTLFHSLVVKCTAAS